MTFRLLHGSKTADGIRDQTGAKSRMACSLVAISRNDPCGHELERSVVSINA